MAFSSFYSFDQLSIRRIRNFEADRELRKRGIEPSSWKTKKKEAKLAFQAEIPHTDLHHAYVLKNYSRTFLCSKSMILIKARKFTLTSLHLKSVLIFPNSKKGNFTCFNFSKR